MYKDKLIAVLIPMFNEEQQIHTVIQTLPDYVDYVIVIDDCSTDSSVSIVAAETKRNDKIILLQNKVNLGCGGALSKGYKWARDHDVDIAVRVDGDGQMDPNEIQRLLNPIIDSGVVYTKGNRLISGEAFSKIPRTRYFGNAILSFLTKIVSGYWHVADSQSGFSAINKQALREINWDEMYLGYGQPNDLLVRLNVYNYRVKDVETRPIYNVGERSDLKIINVVFPILFLLIRLFFWRMKEKYIIRDFHPLVFFYILGFFLLSCSVILFVRLVYFKLILGFFLEMSALAWFFSISLGLHSLFVGMWLDMDYSRTVQRD